MKKALYIFVMACFLFSGTASINAAEDYSGRGLITVGDNSYIFIEKNGVPGKNPEPILNTLKHFQDTHPNLEIMSWSIEKQQWAYVTSDYIYGIWVHHRPKK